MTATGSRLCAPALAIAALLVVCPGPASAQSIASLFTSLPSDFAHLFTPANGMIAGTAGAGSLAVHPKDDEIAADVFAPTGGRHDFFRAGATLGDGVEQGGFALGMTSSAARRAARASPRSVPTWSTRRSSAA